MFVLACEGTLEGIFVGIVDGIPEGRPDGWPDDGNPDGALLGNEFVAFGSDPIDPTHEKF